MMDPRTQRFGAPKKGGMRRNEAKAKVKKKKKERRRSVERKEKNVAHEKAGCHLQHCSEDEKLTYTHITTVYVFPLLVPTPACALFFSSQWKTNELVLSLFASFQFAC